MVQESTATPASAGSDRSTLLNALIGAVVTVITAPLLPVAAVFGGAAAGYLQRADLAGGAKVGALSGAIASVPAIFVVWLGVGLFLLGMDPLGFTTVFAILIFVLVAGYLVGAGALGGAIGAYLRREL